MAFFSADQNRVTLAGILKAAPVEVPGTKFCRGILVWGYGMTRSSEISLWIPQGMAKGLEQDDRIVLRGRLAEKRYISPISRRVVSEIFVQPTSLEKTKMRDMNECTLSGRIVRNPSSFKAADGSDIITSMLDAQVSFSQADENGEEKIVTRSHQIPIRARGEMARVLESMRKGDYAMVVGRLISYWDQRGFFDFRLSADVVVKMAPPSDAPARHVVVSSQARDRAEGESARNEKTHIREQMRQQKAAAKAAEEGAAQDIPQTSDIIAPPVSGDEE